MTRESTTKFVNHFGRRRVFLPVIHPVSEFTALTSIETAIDCGADGVFLINQGMRSEMLLDFIATKVASRFPDLWMGVNLLGVHPDEVIRKIKDLPIHGIWSDDAKIDERTVHQPAAERYLRAKEEYAWSGVYFGGVAFKHQRNVHDDLLPMVATVSRPWMDVITTSGPATGVAAPLAKIQALRSGAGDFPIALASGVHVENIRSYLPFVDAFLVASAIETVMNSGILVAERTRLLADVIHGFEG